MTRRWKWWWIAKPAFFLACLTPITLLFYWAFTDQLSANPISDVTNETGVWTLRFVMITLAFTPIRRITGWQTIIRFRRMTGLFAFFYGSLHFLTYIWLDQGLHFDDIVKDIPKRPFITVGFTAFVLMIPLALTSTKKWISRIGGRRWQLLHCLVYFTGIAGVVHYYWGVKLDTTRPIRYAMLLVALLGSRALYRVLAARRKTHAYEESVVRTT
jgi:sulfoxide reductase heme-binding subunit YedZ